MTQTSLANELVWQQLESRLVQGPTWRHRQVLWNRAKQLGVPNMRQDRYVGVRLRAIESFLQQLAALDLEGQSSSASLPEILADIVLVDGRLVHLNKSLNVMTLKQAQSLGPIASQRYAQIALQENDFWALINGSMADEAVFARIEDGFQGHLTIYLHAHAPSNMSFPRLTLWVGKEANLQIDVISSGLDEHLSVEFLEIIQESNSSVQMTWSRREGSQSLSMGYLRASLQAKAQLQFCDLCSGGLVNRLDAHVQLAQEGSEARLYGLNLLEKQSQSQVNVMIEHQAPGCQSTQLFKSALKDSARSTFQGKIYVHSQAQQTQAYQLSRNLLLSPQAQAQSRPNLEIFADDVKASHGSATGEVDEEALFYLLSRGIDRTVATGLLVHGFSCEILQYVNSDLRSHWKQKIDQF